MKDLKIFTKNIEQKAIDDINAFMELEAFKNSKVRIMPDVHAGKGCVIGFTATIKDKIIHNSINQIKFPIKINQTNYIFQ